MELSVGNTKHDMHYIVYINATQKKLPASESICMALITKYTKKI